MVKQQHCYARLLIFLFFASMCRYQEAIDDCQAALNLDPSLWRVMNRKGRAHMRLGQLQEADACFTRVLELTTPPHQRSTRSYGDSQETLEQGACGRGDWLRLCTVDLTEPCAFLVQRGRTLGRT